MIAKGGRHLVLIMAIATLTLTTMAVITGGWFQVFYIVLACLSSIILISFCVFFRDPHKSVGNGIVSPADGWVREIRTMHGDAIGECTRISIFLEVTNVHVNRMPMVGTIEQMKRHHGTHFRAIAGESDKNEHLTYTVDTGIGKIKIIQMVGFWARRIVPYVNVGDKLKKGQRFGLICFGSRVDLYLPNDGVKVIIKEGDKVKGGITTIAIQKSRTS